MRFIALFCSGLSPWKALGILINIEHYFTHSFQPQAKLPMFQWKVKRSSLQAVQGVQGDTEGSWIQPEEIHKQLILTMWQSRKRGTGWIIACYSRWCRMVAFKRKRLDDTPNTTRANRNTIISGFTSSIHRNHKTSRSFSAMAIITNALSISAATATLWM